MRRVIPLIVLLFVAPGAFAQGGPPYLTTDPGTPGNLNWEINLAYEPFFFSNQSVSHVPDLDLNFGIGDRIQLTYENAWLRVEAPASQAKFGLGQSNFGVKWRFLDHGENGLSISIFPQGFVNNPGDAVRRGITSPAQTFLMPMEFARKFGPVDVNLEVGYQFVHKGPDGWISGVVVGHEFKKRFEKLELDAEIFSQGTIHPTDAQTVMDIGGRYKIHRPFILLFTAGRSLEPAHSNQAYFLGYFGVQILLPPKSYK